MKPYFYAVFCAITFLFFISCDQTADSQESKELESLKFKGKIAKTYEESEEYWPKKQRPP